MKNVVVIINCNINYIWQILCELFYHSIRLILYEMRQRAKDFMTGNSHFLYTGEKIINLDCCVCDKRTGRSDAKRSTM